MKTLIRILIELAIFAPCIVFAIMFCEYHGPIHDDTIRLLFAAITPLPSYIGALLFDRWYKKKYQPELVEWASN